jgi:hypothetical protein
VTWRDRFELLQAWRAIAVQYQQFNLTIYEDFSMYSDQVGFLVGWRFWELLCKNMRYFGISSDDFSAVIGLLS